MGARITNDRIRNEKWDRCAICDFEYPLSMLWKRRGHLVCREHCDDEDLLGEAEAIIEETS